MSIKVNRNIIFILILILGSSCKQYPYRYTDSVNIKSHLSLDRKKMEFKLINNGNLKYQYGSFEQLNDTIYLCINKNSDVRYLTNIYQIMLKIDLSESTFTILNSKTGCGKQ